MQPKLDLHACGGMSEMHPGTSVTSNMGVCRICKRRVRNVMV